LRAEARRFLLYLFIPAGCLNAFLRRVFCFSFIKEESP